MAAIEEYPSTSRLFVQRHHPDAFVEESWRSGGLYRVCAETMTKTGRPKVTPIGGWCVCEDGAWESAAKRIRRSDGQ